jgi:hypothetical protein
MTGTEKLARLEKALAHGGPTHSPADVVRLIETRQAQLWERGDGVIVTEVQTYPLMKAVHYWLAAGSLHDCLALQNQIDDWARDEGCDMATLTGRAGWCRAAAGWRLTGYAFRKPLGTFWGTESI